MLFYPQLATGAAACYPLTRTVARRTVVNRAPDGSAVKIADADAAEIRWDLRYEGLSDAERSTLESFFATCEGRLRSFTFFDPAGNMLKHSESLSENSWDLDPLIRPEGLRLTNGGQVWQGIAQTIAGPERLTWCFSAEVRGSGQVRVKVGTLESLYDAGAEWCTVWCGGVGDGEAEEVVCRMDLSAGATVEVARLSVQAQPMPGHYRRTTSRCGIYPSTRFEDDRLVFTADGPSNHSTTVRLRSRE
jgi:hypothetical protein